MTVSTAGLTDALVGIVGAEHLLTDPPILERYAVDGVRPRWVARPASLEELSQLLGLASAERLAVVPRGTGERMGLGNLPARVDLVVDMSRLSALKEHTPDDLVATVEAGITLEALRTQLARRRQLLPLDPLVGASRTVGGVVAVNDSGPLRLRYGIARDLVLGVRFVQADGTLTWGGARVVKSVTGYDIPKLLVGSLGTLGILGELTLRLHTVPDTEGHWLIGFPSIDRAGAFLASVRDSSLEPSRLELLNREALDQLELSPVPAAVAVTVGSVVEAVRSQQETLSALALKSGGGELAPLEGGFWSRLPRVLDADGAVLLKVATLPALTAERLSAIDELARLQGLRACVVAEAANGVLHVRLAGALAVDEWERLVIIPLRERVAPEGGSVVVESAPRALKARLDVWGPLEPGALAIMRRLKAEFDPNGVLNPGRFVDRL